MGPKGDEEEDEDGSAGPSLALLALPAPHVRAAIPVRARSPAAAPTKHIRSPLELQCAATVFVAHLASWSFSGGLPPGLFSLVSPLRWVPLAGA